MANERGGQWVSEVGEDFGGSLFLDLVNFSRSFSYRRLGESENGERL